MKDYAIEMLPGARQRFGANRSQEQRGRTCRGPLYQAQFGKIACRSAIRDRLTIPEATENLSGVGEYGRRWRRDTIRTPTPRRGATKTQDKPLVAQSLQSL